MGSPIKAIVPFVDKQEEDAKGGAPMQELYMLPIPMPTYRALAKAAARKGITLAQLLGQAIDKALE